MCACVRACVRACVCVHVLAVSAPRAQEESLAKGPSKQELAVMEYIEKAAGYSDGWNMGELVRGHRGVGVGVSLCLYARFTWHLPSVLAQSACTQHVCAHWPHRPMRMHLSHMGRRHAACRRLRRAERADGPVARRRHAAARAGRATHGDSRPRSRARSRCLQ